MDKKKADLRRKLPSDFAFYQNLQKKYAELMKKRTMLETQMNENKCVLDELNLLKPKAKVFKKCGDVLIRQDMEESRLTVKNRVQYIEKEINNCNKELEIIGKDMKTRGDALAKMNQQIQVAMAMKL